MKDLTPFPDDIVPSPTGPYPHWYAISLLSRYLGGGKGTKAYVASSDYGSKHVCVSAVKHPDGNWSFLAVNENHSPIRVKMKMKYTTSLNKNLYRYVYDSSRVSNQIRYVKPVSIGNVVTEISDIIPARSFVVYSSYGFTWEEWRVGNMGYGEKIMGAEKKRMRTPIRRSRG